MADAALAMSSGIRSWAARSRNHAEKVAVRAGPTDGPPTAVRRSPATTVGVTSAVVVVVFAHSCAHASRLCYFPLSGPRFFGLWWGRCGRPPAATTAAATMSTVTRCCHPQCLASFFPRPPPPVVVIASSPLASPRSQQQ
ncbi:hypothetical protein TW95_gp1439 [Pandoravirus inopinatum]|uniref:Uncharacterized protein n=1 Tax=Pandoravirus inopinatum TaxID=1605721 RepID=A0A0B5IZ81_9VIRU|nr:hypothetical protein TW95_gp1439 [Pandoravirus inopinatum]AJF98173.1 hypothetical protein [Pandoravirus inopinatum]